MKRFNFKKIAVLLTAISVIMSYGITPFADAIDIPDETTTISETTEPSDEITDVDDTTEESVETSTEIPTDSSETETTENTVAPEKEAISDANQDVVEVELDLTDYIYQTGAYFGKGEVPEISDEIPEYVSGDIEAYNDAYGEEAIAEGSDSAQFNAGSTVLDQEISSFKAAIVKTCENWNGTDSTATVTVGSQYPNLQMSKDDVVAAFYETINDNGQLFYVVSALKWYYTQTGAITQIIITFDTSFSKSDVTAFNNKVNSILSGMDSSWNGYEKALYLHDYLVTNCHYDTDTSNYHRTSFDCIVKGSCVCQGYALAYDYLCKRAGVSCDLVTSKDINHAWNMVTVSNNQYFVDCTWDDPFFSGNTLPFKQYCGHTNFLSSYSACNATHKSTDWLINNGTQSATVYGKDTKFDSALWRYSKATMAYNENYQWGFVTSGINYVKTYDFSTYETKQIGSSYANAAYPQIVSVGDGFIVSDNTNIYLINDNGKTTLKTLSGTDAEYRIYSLTKNVSKNTIEYRLYSDVHESDYVKTDSVADPSKISIVGKTVTLSTSRYIYDGKSHKPTVSISGLKQDVDYKVSYPSNTIIVGYKNITITGIGKYEGTVVATYKISPKSTYVTSLYRYSKAIKVYWKKQSTQVSGYQIQYSTSSNFSGAKTITISGTSTTSKKITGLKGGKKYYVRVRTYKTVNGVKFYSDWSAKKYVTTKK